MPGKTTYYKRIQVMLELSAVRKPADAEQFLNSLKNNTPTNFVYRRWDPEKETYRDIPSFNAIKNTFFLAVDIGLLDRKSAKLTSKGKTAADVIRYPQILEKQIENYFQDNGFSIQDLEQASRTLLRRDKITLPTADELYLELFFDDEPNISLPRFRTVLRLLALCDGIQISRRHLYIPR